MRAGVVRAAAGVARRLHSARIAEYGTSLDEDSHRLHALTEGREGTPQEGGAGASAGGWLRSWWSSGSGGSEYMLVDALRLRMAEKETLGWLLDAAEQLEARVSQRHPAHCFSAVSRPFSAVFPPSLCAVRLPGAETERTGEKWRKIRDIRGRNGRETAVAEWRWAQVCAEQGAAAIGGAVNPKAPVRTPQL